MDLFIQISKQFTVIGIGIIILWFIIYAVIDAYYTAKYKCKRVHIVLTDKYENDK